MVSIFGIIVFFGSGISALAVLTLATCYARTLSICLICGILAFFLMLLQCIIFAWAVDFNSAFNSGGQGYGIATGAGFFFVLCLAAYSGVIAWKFSDRKDS